MMPRMNLKKIKGEFIVTENGKPKVFATLIEALKHIGKVTKYEPK